MSPVCEVECEVEVADEEMRPVCKISLDARARAAQRSSVFGRTRYGPFVHLRASSRNEAEHKPACAVSYSTRSEHAAVPFA